MNFSDQLLKAKGFENHVMVHELGDCNQRSITPRLTAIGRARTGAIDHILRLIPSKLEATISSLEPSEFSIIHWSTGATFAGGEKKSYEFSIRSGFATLSTQIEHDGPGGVLMVMEDYHENILRDTGWQFVPVDISESIEEQNHELEDHLTNHPVFELLSDLKLTMNLSKEFTLVAIDQLLYPTSWIYRYGPDEKPTYLILSIDCDGLRVELDEIMALE